MNYASLTGIVFRAPKVNTWGSEGNKKVVLTLLTVEDKRYKDQQQNWQTKEQKDYHKVEVFKKQLVGRVEALKPGTTITAIGKLRSGSYDGKDGNKVYTYNLVADDILNPSRAKRSWKANGQQQQAPAPAPTPQPQQVATQPSLPELPDDLPF